MTLVPVRDIGKLGVNTDWSPLDLPVTAWTMGTNVRFVDNRIKRGPVFSQIGELTVNTTPRYSVSYKTLNDTAKYLLLNQDGTIIDFQASSPGTTPSQTNISVSGYAPSTATLPYTATIVNGVVYVNRSDRTPWYMSTSGSSFATLPVWDSTWRCESLRAINGVLVAINVTKGATKYPTMVKTSDFTTFGSTPGAWVASPTNSATENILSDLQEPLIDGWPLRDRMILYGTTETWAMEYRGDNLMFNYKRLFSNRGVINQNCVAEYSGTHYVFGYDDIWSHDGYQSKSIALGRVRDFIYNNMIRAQSYQFFVANNPKQGEVMFCYVSTDPYCHFPVGSTYGYPGCNRAAVYNYIYDTWYFYDLPYIVGGSLGVAYTGATYSDLSLAYDNLGGSYDSYFDGSRLYLLTVGQPLAAHPSGAILPAVRIFEPPTVATGAGVLDATATAPCFLENKLMDMDDLGRELRGYKVVNQMWPEATFSAGAPVMTFTWGSSDYSNEVPVYDHSMTFDGSSLNKLDFNAPGRYLSLRMDYDGTQDFSLSGWDIDYQVFGHR